jgi:hypothetical protein
MLSPRQGDALEGAISSESSKRAVLLRMPKRGRRTVRNWSNVALRSVDAESIGVSSDVSGVGLLCPSSAGRIARV